MTKSPRYSKIDMDFEIKFFEGVLKYQPNFIQALKMLGDLYTKKGFYEKGLFVDLRLSELCSRDPLAFYNLACSYSLLNNIENSLLSLKRAIELGYDNFEFLEYDPDLINLKNSRRFQEYYAEVKNKVLLNIIPKVDRL